MTIGINKYKALRCTNLDGNLSKNEKLIYAHLILCLNEIKGYSYPAYPELMKVLGVKRRNSISDTINNLRCKGYIRTKKGYRGQNNYYLLKYIINNKDDTSNNNVTSNKNDTITSNKNDTSLVTETLPNNINDKFNNKFNINTSKDGSKEIKHKYGEYKHVFLTEKEKEKLIKELGENKFNLCIKKLDEAIELKGYKYKNHNLVMRKWVIEAVENDLNKLACLKDKDKIIPFIIGGERFE